MKKAFREQTVSIFTKNFKASSFLLSTNMMLHCIFFLVIEYFMDKSHQYFNTNKDKGNLMNNETIQEEESETDQKYKK